MNGTVSFGQTVRERRSILGLTQTELARRVGCATITIRKIEADDLRPSVQMAERIALSLNIPEEEQLSFVRLARLEKAPSPLPSPAPLPGEIGFTDLSGRAVKGFQLGEKIGSGGFGVVYRSLQTSVEREVAVKIILPRYANHPAFIRRFEGEAQLVARLEHPHIVPLYDYWREPDAAYLIMRLLRGGNLENQIREGPIPIEQVFRFIHQIGLALDAAHRNGVIHRDIKPTNILLDEETNAYLADFGIAQKFEEIDEESLVTHTGLLGSLAYISPEQILAEPVKPQSDIYHLGILLFEMLTGQKPFTGPTPIAYIQQHLKQKLPPLNTYNPDLPSKVNDVIQIATSRDVADRYRDVPSLLQAIQEAFSIDTSFYAGPFAGETRAQWKKGDLSVLENPYVGLRAFTEADAEHFYGRDTLVQELFAQLSEENELSRFLAIVGPSGSGKSSVAKAGLIPALRRGALPGSENWFVLDFSPGTHPWEEVEAALLRVAVNPPDTLLKQLQDGDRGLLRAARRVLPDDGQTDLVLVIDQFEEIFTLVEDEAIRKQFLNSLVMAVLDPHSRLRIIVTLRADFYDRPLQYVDFGDVLRQRSVSVLPMTPDDLEQSINNPAESIGIRLEPMLTTTIIHDLGDQPGTLPLLQYALTELFDQRDGNLMTRTAYEKMGGVTGALARRANEIYDRLDDQGRALTRQIFLRLITLGEGVEDTRRRVLMSELDTLTRKGTPNIKGQDGITDTRSLINDFGRYRLLTFDHDPTSREPTVEIAHEALLHEWKPIRDWLDESRGDIRNQRLLTRAAREWQQSGRDQSYLIPGGTRLNLFTNWREKSGLALTQVEEDYIETSLIADKERQDYDARQARARQKLRRYLVGALLVGLIISASLSLFAFDQWRLANRQRHEAQRQASIGLAALSVQELGGINRDLSVLLALEALEYYPFTSQAAAALARSIDEYRTFRQLDASDSVASLITVAAWSPDGQRIAAGSSPSPNSIIIWEAETGKELLAVNAHADLCGENFLYLRDLAWSPSGEHLAVIAQDSASGDKCGLVVLNTTSGEREFVAQGYDSAARTLDWSPGGKAILTGHEDGNLRLWDSSTGSELQLWKGHEGAVLDVRFSPDGRLIASASGDATIGLWDAETGMSQLNLVGHAGPVRSLSWSPDGSYLASGGQDGLVRVWDTATGEITLVLPGHTEEVVIVTWSSDGRRIASQGLEAIVKVWDAATGGFLYQISNTAPEPGTKRGFVEFSPDNQWILAGGSRVLGPRIWDASTKVPKLFGHTFGQEWGGWSPDGAYIATSGEDGSARLWDATTGEQLKEFEGGSFWGDWSPDSDHLVFAQDEGATSLQVWQVETAEALSQFSAPEDEYRSPQFLTMSWSPDGSMIAAAAFRPGIPQPIYIWDANTATLIQTLQTDDVCMQGWPRWSPDSSRIASGCIFVESGINTPARIWEVASGKELMTLKSDYGWTYRTVWSPDGGQILVTYENGVAVIWDAMSGEPLFTYAEHQGQVDGAWAPDGQLIATVDFASQQIKIWNPENGQELYSFSVPGAPLTVGWSPDGSQIIVTGDGLNEPVIKRVWHSAGELIAHAYDCCVSRQLTAEERLQFGLPERPDSSSTRAQSPE